MLPDVPRGAAVDLPPGFRTSGGASAPREPAARPGGPPKAGTKRPRPEVRGAEGTAAGFSATIACRPSAARSRGQGCGRARAVGRAHHRTRWTENRRWPVRRSVVVGEDVADVIGASVDLRLDSASMREKVMVFAGMSHDGCSVPRMRGEASRVSAAGLPTRPAWRGHASASRSPKMSGPSKRSSAVLLFLLDALLDDAVALRPGHRGKRVARPGLVGGIGDWCHVLSPSPGVSPLRSARLRPPVRSATRRPDGAVSGPTARKRADARGAGPRGGKRDCRRPESLQKPATVSVNTGFHRPGRPVRASP